MGIKYYKKGQGVIVRTVALVSVMLIVFFGCYALYRYIPLVDVSQVSHPPTFWGTSLITIGFFDFSITVGMVICGVLFILLIFFLYLWILNNPKVVDFLIETEIELKKVSWPPRSQYTSSSIAVIVTVIILCCFLVIVDFLIQQLMYLLRLR